MDKLFTECFVCGSTGKTTAIGDKSKLVECPKCMGTGIILTESGKQTIKLLDLLEKIPRLRVQA